MKFSKLGVRYLILHALLNWSNSFFLPLFIIAYFRIMVFLTTGNSSSSPESVLKVQLYLEIRFYFKTFLFKNNHPSPLIWLTDVFIFTNISFSISPSVYSFGLMNFHRPNTNRNEDVLPQPQALILKDLTLSWKYLRFHPLLLNVRPMTDISIAGSNVIAR